MFLANLEVTYRRAARIYWCTLCTERAKHSIRNVATCDRGFSRHFAFTCLKRHCMYMFTNTPTPAHFTVQHEHAKERERTKCLEYLLETRLRSSHQPMFVCTSQLWGKSDPGNCPAKCTTDVRSHDRYKRSLTVRLSSMYSLYWMY